MAKLTLNTFEFNILNKILEWLPEGDIVNISKAIGEFGEDIRVTMNFAINYRYPSTNEHLEKFLIYNGFLKTKGDKLRLTIKGVKLRESKTYESYLKSLKEIKPKINLKLIGKILGIILTSLLILGAILKAIQIYQQLPK